MYSFFLFVPLLGETVPAQTFKSHNRPHHRLWWATRRTKKKIVSYISNILLTHPSLSTARVHSSWHEVKREATAVANVRRERGKPNKTTKKKKKVENAWK